MGTSASTSGTSGAQAPRAATARRRHGRFRDRSHAGQELAVALDHLSDELPVIVGLPRGGVPVAAEVARALGATLDVVIVRKLGVPFQPEVGMGAIGEGGVRLVDHDLVRRVGISAEQITEVEDRERRAIEERTRLYRAERPMTSLEGRTVVIVDDGIATGGTALAAVAVVRAYGAAYVVLATPVAAAQTLPQLRSVVDELVVLEARPDMGAVGFWYLNFDPTTDDEVLRLLREGDERRSAAVAPYNSGSTGSVTRDDDIVFPTDGVALGGHLTVPPGAIGVVIFAHGSGSSRHSHRNRAVAEFLNEFGLATLLFDLLTEDESLRRDKVFDVELLARRLSAATDWVRQEPGMKHLPLGYFGASTGAAAALWAAADPDADVTAVVSRGGRPDLAAERLGAVRAPTLLIVGGADEAVLLLNRNAAHRLGVEHQLAVVPGAGHLFEEPGALRYVARLAAAWFERHFARPDPRRHLS